MAASGHGPIVRANDLTTAGAGRLLVAAVLTLCAGAGLAEDTTETHGICNVSTLIGACEITPYVEDDVLLLVSSAPSCSLVDWTLDGASRRTVIVDQGARIGRLETSAAGPDAPLDRVAVENCVEVHDSRLDPEVYAARQKLTSSEQEQEYQRQLRRMERERRRPTSPQNIDTFYPTLPPDTYP